MSSPTTETTTDAAPAKRRRRDAKQDAGPPEPAVAGPPKQRRRPALIGLGIALVALGGAGAAWFATSASDTQNVLAVRENIPRGSVIEEDDLTTAAITGDPALEPIPATRSADIIGQVAGVDLVAGSLLTDGAIAAELTPGEGESLVGVAVTAAQLPYEELVPGDTVLIVNTPRAQDNPPKDAPESIEARVASSDVDPDSGQRVVNVVVAQKDAPTLAARVATGRISLVLEPRVSESTGDSEEG